MKLIHTLIFSLIAISSVAQEIITVTGKVLDAKTNIPLVNAGVGLKNHPYGTYTDHEGKFGLEFPETAYDDSLFVSYVGYTVLKNKLPGSKLIDGLYLLEESATVLDEVTILAQSLDKFEIKKIESRLRLIKGNLYAFNMELTNKEYNQFLSYLIQSNQKALYEKYKPNYSKYEGSLLTFFKGYHTQQAEVNDKKYILTYNEYPVVNITHEAALAYCEWLTEQYNGSSKKKFKQATFRLPKIKEWQIAALGYPKFQSWVLEENNVEVRIPDHPGEMLGKQKKTIPFKGNDIRYPWFAAYEYRNKAQNNKNCWMGNFKIPEGVVSCYAYRPDGDGFSYIGKCSSYFPNDMGLFDVVGNVAEMIDEKGKGRWWQLES
ncbi:MAG TPA: SUMF1/EgtB/PvdO family nonheme iron enzyme [Cyclobacteriaceae bacterium]